MTNETATSEAPEDAAEERTLEDVMEDLNEALEDLAIAQEGYEEAEDYYDGTVDEKFSSREINRLLSGSASSFYVNLAARVVTAVTDRLEIAAVTATDNLLPEEGGLSNEAGGGSGSDGETEDVSNTTESGSGGSATKKDVAPSKPSEGISNTTESGSGESASGGPADEVLAEDMVNDVTKVLNTSVWHHNQLDIDAPNAHVKTCTHGDGYLFVWGSEDGENVDVFYHSARTTRIIYDEENPRLKKYAIKMWRIGRGQRERVRVNVYYPNDIYKLESKGVPQTIRGNDFVPFKDEYTDDDGWMENPYGQVPFFHLRTDTPYGSPEHLAAYGPQDAITKLNANLMSVVDMAAFPQRWALAASEALNDDEFEWEDEEAEPGEQNSTLVSGPGRIWNLKGIQAVGQFQEARVQQFLDPMNKMAEFMASATGTPLSHLNKYSGTSSTPLSGQSQKQAEITLLKKIMARQRSFGSTWREALEFAMRILGYDVTVNVQWESSQIENDKAAWETAEIQHRLGMPLRQIFLEMGYTEAQVNKMGFTDDKPDGKKTLTPEMEAQAAAPLPPNLAANQLQQGQTLAGGKADPAAAAPAVVVAPPTQK